MRQTIQLFMLIACVCLFSLPGSAQNNKPNSAKNGDSRIVKALTEVESEYELVKDGNFYNVSYKTTGKRTQSALIASDTQNIFGAEMRLVISFAQIGGAIPTPAVAYLMLQENLENFPNAWAVEKDKNGKFTISNLVYVPADCNGKTLKEALSSVMIAADKMEESLTKEDKF